MKDKEKQIEEMSKETINKQWQKRDEYCLRIQKAMQYEGNCDHEDVPSILVDYEEEIKKELIPKDSVVLSREEYNLIDHNIKHLETVCNAHEKEIAYWEEETKVARQEIDNAVKETAEKIYLQAKAIVDATKHIVQGREYLHIDALKEIIKSCGVEIKE